MEFKSENRSFSYCEGDRRLKRDSLEENKQEERNTIKSEWLKKQTHSMVKRWQEKFCVLKVESFEYYNKKNLLQPAGSFNFAQVRVEVYIRKEKEFVIAPEGCERVFTFKCSSSSCCLSWLSALRSSLSLSSAPSFPSLSPSFFRFPQLSSSSFASVAQTGDILLFRSTSLISKAQRALSRSSYDHVALIVRDDFSLGFLEATRVVGVNLLQWADFLAHNWHLLYSRLVFRKLRVPDHRKVELRIKEFVLENTGKKFSASIGKILGRRRSRPDDGFFCSELVASAYQFAGLLPGDIDPSSYWPGNFSNDRPLRLVSSSLGALTEINFSLG
jgi:hypothetical protein